MNQSTNLTAQAVSHAVFTDGTTLKTTSRLVTEIFGKRHDDVLRAIRNLDCSEDFKLRNFAELEYIDGRGNTQPMVEMTFDGFTFVAMGFTGAKAAAFKEAYIAEFNRMRTQQQIEANQRMAMLEKYARLPILPLTAETRASVQQYLSEKMPVGDIARVCRCAQATVRMIRDGVIDLRQQHLQWAEQDEAAGDAEGARLNREAAQGGAT